MGNPPSATRLMQPGASGTKAMVKDTSQVTTSPRFMPVLKGALPANNLVPLVN